MNKNEAIQNLQEVGLAYFYDFDKPIESIFREIQNHIVQGPEIDRVFWKQLLASLQYVLRNSNEQELDSIQRKFFGYSNEVDQALGKKISQSYTIKSSKAFFEQLANHLSNSLTPAKNST